MAGAAVTLNLLDLVKSRKLFDKLIDFDRRELLESAAALVVSQTQKRIRNEKQAPDGTPWPAWSPRYAETRHANQSLLVSEGILVASITPEVVDDATALIHPGSNLVYARSMQQGDPRRNIPVRPYLGFSEQNKKEIGALVLHFFEDLTYGG